MTDYSAEEIEEALAKFQSLPRTDPEWQKAFELLDTLGLIKMTINQDWFKARIAEMQARGEPILPDTFPGIKITRKVKGPGGEEQSVDNNWP
jgi:hypothetical protein